MEYNNTSMPLWKAMDLWVKFCRNLKIVAAVATDTMLFVAVCRQSI